MCVCVGVCVYVCVLLGVCFSAMLIHGYLPQSLMDTNSKIIPLVKKNKCGKLSDKNNYMCSIAVKNTLFRTFCTPMYTCHLWWN